MESSLLGTPLFFEDEDSSVPQKGVEWRATSAYIDIMVSISWMRNF